MTDSGGISAGLGTGGNAESRMGAAGAGRGGWWLWAVYLGVSWTWCIGMFLPALLWRDYGAWSFVVFAVPNVVGAAALGLVMRTPEASRLFMERHRWACFAFSAVTVAFQVFFAAWVARIMGGGVWNLGWVLCVVATVVSGDWMRRWALLGAVAVWVVSVVTIGATVAREGGAGLLGDVLTEPGVLPVDHLVPLALVCVLGFGLCPYLDRTFHRGRIETGAKSVRAFGLGFGFFFALMIVGTLLTAPVLMWVTAPEGGAGGLAVGRLLIALFAAHTMPQLVYTCWVHGGAARGGGERYGMGAVALLIGLAVMLSGDPLIRAYGNERWMNPLFGGEVVYRCFMGCYGLVFPAYVAIVAWPAARGGRVMTMRNLVVFGVVLVGAMGFYWMGFVERRTWWVAVGVGVVLAGVFAARLKGAKASALSR